MSMGIFQTQIHFSVSNLYCAWQFGLDFRKALVLGNLHEYRNK